MGEGRRGFRGNVEVSSVAADDHLLPVLSLHLASQPKMASVARPSPKELGLLLGLEQGLDGRAVDLLTCQALGDSGLADQVSRSLYQLCC